VAGGASWWGGGDVIDLPWYMDVGLALLCIGGPLVLLGIGLSFIDQKRWK
jgi:hypothetical protein